MCPPFLFSGPLWKGAPPKAVEVAFGSFALCCIYVSLAGPRGGTLRPGQAAEKTRKPPCRHLENVYTVAGYFSNTNERYTLAKQQGDVYNKPQVKDEIPLCRRSCACAGHGERQLPMAAVLILFLPKLIAN